MQRLWKRFSTRAGKAVLSLALALALIGSLALTAVTPVATAQTEDGAAVVAAKSSDAKVLEAKIDVNTTVLRNYRKLNGFYPKLARTLVENAPYANEADMLAIPGLSERQKQRIHDNIDNFEFGPYDEGINSLETRINKGLYD